MKLQIATNLSLPSDVVTQTFAILAIRRVGKTYTASVLAEEMMKAGLPFVALDPTGAWWGLRASADGKREGFPVVIIGGEHGDVPLEPTAGKVLADLVVDHPGWYVIDLSQTSSNAEQDRIAGDFAEQLYRRKANNRFPLHLFVDEADAFAPQQAFPNQKRMLGAFEALVRRGGIRGIGTTLITQRPAVLNKNVLTQADNLIVLRVTSPQDRVAIDDWVKGNGTKEQRDVMMNGLAALQQGEAWIWSPGTLGIFQKVRIRERETFNSSATPKAGEHQIEPQKLASVDLDKLRDKIAATIEKAKADDPQILRKRIAEMERELKGKPAQVDQAAIERAVGEAERRCVETFLEVEAAYQKIVEQLHDRLRNIAQTATGGEEVFVSLPPQPQPWTKPMITKRRAVSLDDVAGSIASAVQTTGAQHFSQPQQAKAPKSAPTANSNQSLSKTERAILTVLAQYPQRTKIQIGILSGYSHSSGGFNAAIARLRAEGWIEGPAGALRITVTGKDAVGEVEPLPTGEDLINYWLNRFTGCQRAILERLTWIWPKTMTKQELGTATGYRDSSGGFNSALAELRALELINKGKDIKASEIFFE